MDWNAPHAGYVGAGYALMAILWLWGIIDTLLQARKARRNMK